MQVDAEKIANILNAYKSGSTKTDISRVYDVSIDLTRLVVNDNGNHLLIKPHNMTTTRKKSAWEELPIHPAALKLPMMNKEEIKELAADISKNGLQEPIVLFVDNREEPKGARAPFPSYLLDGRNRLAALKLLGITDPSNAPGGSMAPQEGMIARKIRRLPALEKVTSMSMAGRAKEEWRTCTNPEVYVLSMNVHRRHLSPIQKREAIASFIKADPRASNREVAEKLKVSDHTVAEVRSKSAENAQVAQNPLTRMRSQLFSR